jgi:hypothetical protein
MFRLPPVQTRIEHVDPMVVRDMGGEFDILPTAISEKLLVIETRIGD